MTAVRVTGRTATKVTLVWNVDVAKEWIYILHYNEKNMTFQHNNNHVLSYTLSALKPGTEYTFSVVTQFFELNSKAYERFTVTGKEILIAG